MSMKIIMTNKSAKDPNTKCPNTKCTGQPDEIPNRQIFFCQTCHLAYSLIPAEIEKEPTSDGSQDTSDIVGISPYRRRSVGSAPGPIILGVDNQIASFKRIHLITPRVRETARVNTHSTVDNYSPPLVASSRHSYWTCCQCDQDNRSSVGQCGLTCAHSQCNNCTSFRVAM